MLIDSEIDLFNALRIQRSTRAHKQSPALEHANCELLQGKICCLSQVVDYGKDGASIFLVVTDLGVYLEKPISSERGRDEASRL